MMGREIIEATGNYTEKGLEGQSKLGFSSE